MERPHRTKARAHVDDWLPRERVLLIVFAAATIGVFYLCYRIARPFVPALTWALVLAVIAFPLHARLVAWMRRPGLAAGVAVVVVTVVIALPAALVVREIAGQAVQSAEAAATMLDPERWKATLERFPRLAPAVAWLQRERALRDNLASASAEATRTLRAVVQKTLDTAVAALVTVFLLFYFLRDHERLFRTVRRLVPLAPPEVDEVATRVRDTIHAIVFGTLAVAAIQGTLGGLMFGWLGLPAPLLWGAIMALLAVLPVLGAALVWIPAAVWLALEGAPEKALLLTAWGAVVVGLIDNVLYPVLVRNRLRVHTVPVFIAVLGGLIAFGATGVVLGPLVLALAMALLDIWRRRMALGAVESGIDRPN